MDPLIGLRTSWRPASFLIRIVPVGVAFAHVLGFRALRQWGEVEGVASARPIEAILAPASAEGRPDVGPSPLPTATAPSITRSEEPPVVPTPEPPRDVMPEDPSPTVASAADDAGSTGSSRESLPSSERPSAEVQSGAVRESEVGSSGTTTGATVASGYRTNPAPEYPMPSRLAGEEGRVELEVVVGTAGAPVSVKLARSSRFPRLDGAALQAVWNWKFRPALREGRPVRASVLVPIRFSLSDS